MDKTANCAAIVLEPRPRASVALIQARARQLWSGWEFWSLFNPGPLLTRHPQRIDTRLTVATSIGYGLWCDGRPHALTLVVASFTCQLPVVKGVALKMRTKNPSSGYTMLELLVSVLVMGVMVAATLAEMQPTLQQFHANSAAYLVEGQMRLARQTAIAQRRDVVLAFVGNNEITLTIQNIPAGTTVLSNVFLPPTVTFLQFAGNGDTPDAFGDSGATCFNYVPPPTGSCSNPPIIQFQSDGTLIDGNGNQLDGSIFIGVTNMSTTARAVTILGATGQVRMYHGTGAGWVQQ